jgi:hypothetical protein
MFSPVMKGVGSEKRFLPQVLRHYRSGRRPGRVSLGEIVTIMWAPEGRGTLPPTSPERFDPGTLDAAARPDRSM